MRKAKLEHAPESEEEAMPPASLIRQDWYWLSANLVEWRIARVNSGYELVADNGFGQVVELQSQEKFDDWRQYNTSGSELG